MNRLTKWLGKRQGKRLCWYCKDTWLSGFYDNGNCMTCPKCNSSYIYNWKRPFWPTKQVTAFTADPDQLSSIEIAFQYKDKSCFVNHRFIDKQTRIVIDWGKWTLSNPTFTLPLCVDKITPFNVEEKVKTICLF